MDLARKSRVTIENWKEIEGGGKIRVFMLHEQKIIIEYKKK